MSKLAVLGVSNSGCLLKNRQSKIKANVKSDKYCFHHFFLCYQCESYLSSAVLRISNRLYSGKAFFSKDSLFCSSQLICLLMVLLKFDLLLKDNCIMFHFKVNADKSFRSYISPENALNC